MPVCEVAGDQTLHRVSTSWWRRTSLVAAQRIQIISARLHLLLKATTGGQGHSHERWTIGLPGIVSPTWKSILTMVASSPENPCIARKGRNVRNGSRQPTKPPHGFGSVGEIYNGLRPGSIEDPRSKLPQGS